LAAKNTALKITAILI